jgi:hypothetical protein
MTPYSYVSFYDIDGDGESEIIASLLNQSKDLGWLGQYFQVLKRVNGIWTDITDSVFPNQDGIQSMPAEWCYRVQILDFDKDGKLDLLCSAYTSNIWSFNDGIFSRSKTIKARVVAVKLLGVDYLIEFDTDSKSMKISGYRL